MPVFFYMSAIKDGRYPVELNGKIYHLLFSLNVLDEVQDRFGGFDKLNQVFDQNNPKMMKDLKWLLTTLINEGMDEDAGEKELTDRQVGKMIHLGNINEIKNAILGAFAYGANGGEENEESDKEESDKEESDKEEQGNNQSAQEY